MKKFLFTFACLTLTVSLLGACAQPAGVTKKLPPQVAPIVPAPASSLWLPVLVYHHIGTPPKYLTSAEKSLFIEPGWLEKHLAYLKQNNFETVKFSDVAAYFESGKPLPIGPEKKPVIISFDDGYLNTLEGGFPLLKKYGMIGTAFIPTNLVGLGRGKGTRMTWEDLATLRDAGWEIGSHSLWHPYLTKSKKARAEIFDSKKILEEKLGISVTTFAYPFGDYNTNIERMVKDAGYTSARSFTTGNGISQENLFHIPVVRVWGNLDLSVWKKQLFPPG